MREQDHQMEISKLRVTAARFIQQEPTSPEAVEAARDALDAMCQGAARHGLSTADVIRAVLGPAFEADRGCGCHSCRSRRDQSYEDMCQRVGMPAG